MKLGRIVATTAVACTFALSAFADTHSEAMDMTCGDFMKLDDAARLALVTEILTDSTKASKLSPEEHLVVVDQGCYGKDHSKASEMIPTN